MEKTLFKNFIKYASLNILGMMGLSLYILADTYFVSKAMGPTGLASLNLSISIYSVIHGIGLMIGIGGASRFSILKSQNEIGKASIVFSTAIKTGIIIGMLLAILGVFGTEHLALALGADSATLALTQTYLTTILFFAMLFIVNNILLAFVRNDNNPKLSMIAMLVGSFSNVILDYILIFPLDMGMFGAAFATTLAPLISIFVLLLHFIDKKNALAFWKSKLQWNLIPDILSLGSSAFIIEVSSAVVLITFNLVILGIEGNLGVAAYGIVANLALVGIAVFTGLSQGIQPLISKHYGLKEHAETRKVRQFSVLTSVAIAMIIYIFILLFSDSIIQIFNSENNMEIARIAEIGLKVYFIGFLFAGVNIVTAIFLSATENPKDAFFITIARGLVIMVPLVLILSNILGMMGVWLAFVVTEFLVTLLGIYLKEKKKEIVYVKQAA
ncbi:MATE family efflux transporter [Lacticigenium naphthae]|uniref:MATE family efflux transporter n=1 Tax=Lacticigenium naphthae TaxID=515351 RepID=UPI0004006112|nr:MATE family efflux transporter [Lacticigenium naphthae]